MMTLCDINQQNESKTERFVIHNRRFFTPQKVRSRDLAGSWSCTKRPFLLIQNDPRVLKYQTRFNVRATTQSEPAIEATIEAHLPKSIHKSIPKSIPKSITKSSDRRDKLQSTSKGTSSQRMTKSLSKLEVLSSLIANIRIKFRISEPKLAKCIPENKKVSKVAGEPAKLKTDFQYYHSKIKLRKQQKYGLLHMEGVQCKLGISERESVRKSLKKHEKASHLEPAQ